LRVTVAAYVISLVEPLPRTLMSSTEVAVSLRPVSTTRSSARVVSV
jgi:hypothetical protein